MLLESASEITDAPRPTTATGFCGSFGFLNNGIKAVESNVLNVEHLVPVDYWLLLVGAKVECLAAV